MYIRTTTNSKMRGPVQGGDVPAGRWTGNWKGVPGQYDRRHQELFWRRWL